MRSAVYLTSSVSGVTVAQVMALVPTSIVAALVDPVRYPALLVAALLTAVFWDAIFAYLRKRNAGFHGITTALIVTVLVPADLALWQLVLTLSLGVILGELIFGGRGFGFLGPAVVAVSLLVFSFPEVQLANGSQALALATLPGALLLFFFGLVSWRVILGTFVGVFALAALSGESVDVVAITTILAFSLIFLICDPTAAAVTNPGRWLHGLLAGGLIVLFSGGSDMTTEAIVFAALTASIFAPLIDHLIILLHARRWRNAHA